MQSVGKATDLFFFPPRSLVSRFLHSLELCHVRRLFSQEKSTKTATVIKLCVDLFTTLVNFLFPAFSYVLKTASCSYPSLNGASNFPSHVHLLSFIPPDFADADEALSFLTSCLAFRVSSQVVLHRQLPACLYFTFSLPCL